MVILGIDPGSVIMGYGIIRIVRNEPQLLLMGILDQRKISDHYTKIARIFQRTLEIIREYHPDAMAIEAPFHGNNVQSMLKLGRAQGAAISASLYESVPVFEYAPRKVKQSITGHGECSKEQVARMLQLTLKTELKPDTFDATDGLAVALCHYYELCNPVKAGSSKNWEDFIRKNPDRIS